MKSSCNAKYYSINENNGNESINVMYQKEMT